MPITRAERGDPAGQAARQRNEIDQGFAAARLIADGQKLAIGGETMIVVAPLGKAGVDAHRFSALNRQSIDVAARVEEEKSSVAGPVGGFEVVQGVIDDAAIPGGNVDGFQGRVQYRLFIRQLVVEQFDVREASFFQFCIVVSADRESDVKRVSHTQSEKGAGWLKRRRMSDAAGRGSIGGHDGRDKKEFTLSFQGETRCWQARRLPYDGLDF